MHAVAHKAHHTRVHTPTARNTKPGACALGRPRVCGRVVVVVVCVCVVCVSRRGSQRLHPNSAAPPLPTRPHHTTSPHAAHAPPTYHSEAPRRALCANRHVCAVTKGQVGAREWRGGVLSSKRTRRCGFGLVRRGAHPHRFLGPSSLHFCIQSSNGLCARGKYLLYCS